MKPHAPTSYDQLPYGLAPLIETHPRRMEAAAHLHGMKAPSTDNCRVLELGCAVGGNIVPMAYGLPGATLVGIDLSSRQIESAQAFARAAGVNNLELRCASIMDVTPQWGEFDYIIAHGVFSWVEREVQEKILAICAEQLSERGVGYISFNCYPGAHSRIWVREAMLFHIEGIQDSIERVRAAREFVTALSESPFMRAEHKALVAAEARYIQGKSDSYIAHEYLEAHNEPIYFRAFAQRCAGHRLQYLADALYNGLLAAEECAPSRIWLQSCGEDVVRAEQYSDFVHGREFRRALICREGIPLDRRGMAQRLTDLSAVGYLQPKSHGGGYTRFEHLSGAAHISDSRAAFDALTTLTRRFPQAMPVRELARGAHWDEVARAVLKCWANGMIELYLHDPVFCREPGLRPRASRIAQHLLKSGPRIINLRHELIDVYETHLGVLALLDGTRTRDEIAAEAKMPRAEVDQVIAALATAALIEA